MVLRVFGVHREAEHLKQYFSELRIRIIESEPVDPSLWPHYCVPSVGDVTVYHNDTIPSVASHMQ